MNPIWREVERTTEHLNRGHWKNKHVGGRRRLYLPCGHYELRKISQGVPERVRCIRCEDLRDGAVSSQDNGDGTMTVERWNKDTSAPSRTIEPTTFENRHSDIAEKK